MIIENLSKEARQELKKRLKTISLDIEIKTKNISGYFEPKNIELIFNQSNIPDKTKAIKAVKDMLYDFRLYCFKNNI